MTHQLISKQQNRLQGELAIAEVEQVLEGGTEKIKDHGVVVALRAEPSHKGNTNASSEGLVDLGLILELGMLSLHRFEFDGDLLAGNDVDP